MLQVHKISLGFEIYPQLLFWQFSIPVFIFNKKGKLHFIHDILCFIN